jgi:hypothetical protein
VSSLILITPFEKSLAGQAAERIVDQTHDLAQPRSLSRLWIRHGRQTFRKNLLIAFRVPTPKTWGLQMNLNGLPFHGKSRIRLTYPLWYDTRDWEQAG